GLEAIRSLGLRGPGARVRRQVAAEAGSTPPPVRWNPGDSRPDQVVAFLESLPVTKGILAGSLMRLLPDQRDFVHAVYAEDSPVRIGVKSEPRGNGKTGLVAGLALCHLVGPVAEPRGEIYSAAIDLKQAALIFAEMEAIVL